MAVLEKYLTYCKNAYLDKIMNWRLQYLAFKLSPKADLFLKLRLNTKR